MTFLRWLILTLGIPAIFSGVLCAQAVSEKWLTISAPKNDVSFNVPSDFLVNNEGESSSLYYRGGGVFIHFSVQNVADPRKKLQDFRVNRNGDSRFDYKAFTNGDFGGDVGIAQDNGYSVSAYIASDVAFYMISISASSSADPTLARFLNSVRLRQKHLVRQTATVDESLQVVELAKLKTSPEIVEALARREPGNIPVEYVDAGVFDNDGDDGGKISYTKALIVLYQPKAVYSDSARQKMENAVVRLRITFSAVGTIGKIKVLGPRLKNGLTEQAIKAAKRIKFIPPELDGKPVEVEVLRIYTFMMFDKT